MTTIERGESKREEARVAVIDDLADCDELKRRVLETIKTFSEERRGVIVGTVLFVLGEILAEAHCEHSRNRHDVRPILGALASQLRIAIQRADDADAAPEENKSNSTSLPLNTDQSHE